MRTGKKKKPNKIQGVLQTCHREKGRGRKKRQGVLVAKCLTVFLHARMFILSANEEEEQVE